MASTPSFSLCKALPYKHDETVAKVTDSLRAHGFGIMFTVPFSKTLKEKVNLLFLGIN